MGVRRGTRSQRVGAYLLDQTEDGICVREQGLKDYETRVDTLVTVDTGVFIRFYRNSREDCLILWFRWRRSEPKSFAEGLYYLDGGYPQPLLPLPYRCTKKESEEPVTPPPTHDSLWVEVDGEVTGRRKQEEEGVVDFRLQQGFCRPFCPGPRKTLPRSPFPRSVPFHPPHYSSQPRVSGDCLPSRYTPSR